MPSLLNTFFTLLLAFLPLAFCSAQQSAHNAPSQGSTVLRFDAVPLADTSRAVLKVLICERETPEPILGATVLLRRETDKMHGRVTQADGRCHFKVFPGAYTVRVQMTGLVSFDQSGFLLEKGKSYTLEIAMAKQ